MKRTGERTDTNYSIIPLPTDSDPVEIGDLELFELEKIAVRDVPFDEQEAFYTGTSSSGEETSSSNVEW